MSLLRTQPLKRLGQAPEIRAHVDQFPVIRRQKALFLAAAEVDKRRRIVDLLLRSAYIALGFLKVDRTALRLVILAERGGPGSGSTGSGPEMFGRRTVTGFVLACLPGDPHGHVIGGYGYADGHYRTAPDRQGFRVHSR